MPPSDHCRIEDFSLRSRDLVCVLSTSLTLWHSQELVVFRSEQRVSIPETSQLCGHTIAERTDLALSSPIADARRGICKSDQVPCAKYLAQSSFLVKQDDDLHEG